MTNFCEQGGVCLQWFVRVGEVTARGSVSVRSVSRSKERTGPLEISCHEFKVGHGPWWYAFLQILLTAWMQDSSRIIFNQGWGFTNQVKQITA